MTTNPWTKPVDPELATLAAAEADKFAEQANTAWAAKLGAKANCAILSENLANYAILRARETGVGCGDTAVALVGAAIAVTVTTAKPGRKGAAVRALSELLSSWIAAAGITAEEEDESREDS